MRGRRLAAALLMAALPAGAAASDGFVTAAGTGFALDGKPFYVTGVNNHYLTYASPAEVTRVLDDAVAMHANVVRTFLQPVIGAPDGAVPTIWDFHSQAEASNLGVRGTYLLYWDPKAGRMAVNDGENGLHRVDVLLAEAGRRHLKLLISFLDFWDYTGGAQQMRAWYGSTDTYTVFFSDARTCADYRSWVRTVLERVNPLTGLKYKDDATIFGWDLMNEPDARPDALRTAWVAQMSAYVKSVDPHHLVGSGLSNVEQRLEDIAIPTVDFATWHGYPKYYRMSVGQFDSTITEFCRIARHHNKPVLLEEFGYARSNPDQAQAYRRWLDTLHDDPDCAGWLVWRLVSRQDHGGFPVDEHDQFDIHNDGGPTWEVLRRAATTAKK